MHVVQIEDDKPLREILGAALRASEPKLDLHQFICADDALPYIYANITTIDLMIVDIRLPGSLNGMQLAENVRSQSYKGHLVLTSAYARPTQQVLDALQSEFYHKPWHIVDVIQKLLRLRTASRTGTRPIPVPPKNDPIIKPLVRKLSQ